MDLTNMTQVQINCLRRVKKTLYDEALNVNVDSDRILLEEAPQVQKDEVTYVLEQSVDYLSFRARVKIYVS